MNKKKIIIIFIVFIVLAILIFTIFKIISSIKADQKKAKEVMTKISENYTIYSGQINNFNSKREELAELIGDDDVYYATFYKNSSKINEILENYNNIQNEIINNNKFLNSNCNRYYSDLKINSMCEEFINSYENVSKIFKRDIASYNELVQKYNEWVKDHKDFKTVNEYVIK